MKKKNDVVIHYKETKHEHLFVPSTNYKGTKEQKEVIDDTLKNYMNSIPKAIAIKPSGALSVWHHVTFGYMEYLGVILFDWQEKEQE